MNSPLESPDPRPDKKQDKSWLESVKKAYDRFVRIRGNPQEIALGFSLGLFVGMTPYMGIQMIIAVFLAAMFKWNKIAAATGVWISNPLTAPVLYSITYVTGAKALNSHNVYRLPRELNLDALIMLVKQAPELFWTLTVGGIILGIPLAVAGYYISLSAIQKYRITIAKEKGMLAQTKKKISRKIQSKKRKNR